MKYWTRGRALGQGSTATVSLATSFSSGEVFAVKSAELSQSEFLQREQAILSSISSPRIVGYKGCEITRENNKVLYNLFLEYMPSGTLTDVVQAHGARLEESVIGSYTCQIVEGLDYLHSNGLVHCDIKGRNILIGQSGAKIADFGCAKRIDAAEAAAAEAPISGTPMFMAPEVARAEEQGFASDIWALGCTIIEMATGGAPWSNFNDPVSVLHRIGFSEQLPDFPCFLSDEAKDLLDKCLRRNPKERWTANQLLNHPFLVKFNFQHGKQIQESNSTSYSPTSILEQGFWNSLDESENFDNLIHSSTSPSERIRGLSSPLGGPSWDWDENWITVRGNCNEEDDGDTIMDENESKDDVISSDSVYEETIGGRNIIISSKISGDFLGTCKYGNDSSLVSNNLRFDRDNDMLIPYTSIITLQA